MTEQKEIPNFKFENFDQLKDTLRQEFGVKESDFTIKLQDNGTEVNSSNFMEVFDPSIEVFKLEMVPVS